MRTYKEITIDHSYERRCSASDNWNVYILTSAFAHDKYTDYLERYDRSPSSRWFTRHFQFERIK